jgi:uncharacterized DUF497 family protein
VATARFEWDPKKDRENQRKHGVAFSKAQFAFPDPSRVIAEDLSHSAGEQRYYCFGRVDSGVLTVRFTFRDDIVQIFGASYWRRGKAIYERQIKYTNAPLGRVKIVRDFLPPPEDLVFRDEGVKVTIALSTHSVQFFKDEARKHKTQYQRMIRRLLDAYAAHHSQPPDIRPARPRTVRRARANMMNEGGR